MAELCVAACPRFLDTYRSLRFPIQRVDAAKYMVVDAFGGIAADLDVLPLAHASDIVRDSPYLFDRCSRARKVCNDFLYAQEPGAFPGILIISLRTWRD